MMEAKFESKCSPAYFRSSLGMSSGPQARFFFSLVSADRTSLSVIGVLRGFAGQIKGSKGGLFPVNCCAKYHTLKSVLILKNDIFRADYTT